MSKGASASHRDSAGASVLVHAAHARMPKVVKALLSGSSGVDKDAASDEGVTALIAAAMKVRGAIGEGTLSYNNRSSLHAQLTTVNVGARLNISSVARGWNVDGQGGGYGFIRCVLAHGALLRLFVVVST